MGKEALVVPRAILFKERYFNGFLSASECDYLASILANHTYHARGEELERNESLQQIIPYVWIVNPKTQEVFLYRRAGGTNYSEKRLHHKVSGGIGGHIERQDASNPIYEGMMRELREEVTMENYPAPRIIGYLNDDSDSVGKVHFGVVALAETTSSVLKGDDEMSEGRFYTLKEAEALLSDPLMDVEPWTRLSWPIVKEFILSAVQVD